MDPFVEAVRGAIRVVHYQHYNVSDGSQLPLNRGHHPRLLLRATRTSAERLPTFAL